MNKDLTSNPPASPDQTEGSVLLVSYLEKVIYDLEHRKPAGTVVAEAKELLKTYKQKA